MHLLGLKTQGFNRLIRHYVIDPQREIIEVETPAEAIPLFLIGIVEALGTYLPVDIGIGGIIEISQDDIPVRRLPHHLQHHLHLLLLLDKSIAHTQEYALGMFLFQITKPRLQTVGLKMNIDHPDGVAAHYNISIDRIVVATGWKIDGGGMNDGIF